MLDLILFPIIATLPIAILFAIFGSMSLWDENAVMSHSLSHSLLLPMTLLSVFGFMNPTIATVCNIIVAIIFIILSMNMSLAKEYYSRDAMLLLISFVCLAISMFISSITLTTSDLMSYIMGDIFLVNIEDIVMLYIIAILVVAFMMRYWRILILRVCNQDIAFIQNKHSHRLATILLLLQAIFIAITIKIIGVMMTSAVVLMPATIARVFAKSPIEMMVQAFVIGLCVMILSGVGAILFDMQVSPIVVILYSAVWIIFYAASVLLRKYRSSII